MTNVDWDPDAYLDLMLADIPAYLDLQEQVAEATRQGRKEEFSTFTSFSGDDLPDPQDPATLERSKLAPRPPDRFYRELLGLRRGLPRELEASAEGRRVTLRRGDVELHADFEAKTVELRR